MSMSPTTIEWADRSWNPVTGCRRVSPGCAHCYAEAMARRFWKDRVFTEVRCHPQRLDEPLARRIPTRYFVNSMSDLFHEDVSADFIDLVLAVAALSPHHTFLVLTKRAERMREHLSDPDLAMRVAIAATDGLRIDDYGDHVGLAHAERILWDGETGVFAPVGVTPWPLPNLHVGVSVESPGQLERLDHLAHAPAAVAWVSLEPLLEDVAADLVPYLQDRGEPAGRTLDWIVVGGESGQRARPCDVAWVRRVVRAGQAHGVPVFVKQLGARPIEGPVVDLEAWPAGPEVRKHPTLDMGLWKLRHPKGGDPAEWPADLAVREFPAGACTMTPRTPGGPT